MSTVYTTRTPKTANSQLTKLSKLVVSPQVAAAKVHSIISEADKTRKQGKKISRIFIYQNGQELAGAVNSLPADTKACLIYRRINKVYTLDAVSIHMENAPLFPVELVELLRPRLTGK